MTSPVIKYYFWLSSDWSYLGHRRLIDLAKLRGATISYHPVQMNQLLNATGGIALRQRAQQRQDYRITELKRWKEMLGSDINLSPTHFPVDNQKGLRLVAGAVSAGRDVADLIEALMQAVWIDNRDLSDTNTLVQIAVGFGISESEANTWITSEQTKADLVKNTLDAVRLGVFGAPSYVINGEVFWGQDRLDQLSMRLAQLLPGADRPDLSLIPESKSLWEGTLLGIYTAEQAGVEMEYQNEARLTEGVGIEGDRYATNRGYYSFKPHSDRQVTLIEAETLEAIKRDHDIELLPEETRRNLLTREVPLNQLVNRRFRIGEVELYGGRLNVPCKYLEKLIDKPVFSLLINRSGLNCRILKSGVIRVGDPITPVN